MSLIFDTFPTVEHARAFQAEVKKRFGLDGQVFEDADEAQQHDPFPWEQVPPIVHIDRTVEVSDESATFTTERRVEVLVEKYGGTFIGT